MQESEDTILKIMHRSEEEKLKLYFKLSIPKLRHLCSCVESFYCTCFILFPRSMRKFVLGRFNRDMITVRLLDHARGTNTEADTIDRKVQRIVTHSRYDGATFNNDIALLRFDREIPLEGLLRPVCLPELGMSLLSIYKKFISLLLMS
jgi:hypothetical protein